MICNKSLSISWPGWSKKSWTDSNLGVLTHTVHGGYVVGDFVDAPTKAEEWFEPMVSNVRDFLQ